MDIEGVWADVLRIGIVVLIAYVLILWVAALVWTYRDISARTRDPFSQTIALVLVLVFSLPGLIVYLILRPKQTLADAYDRQLEAEALLHEIQEQATCPACRRRIDDDFIACPYCRTTLRSPCGKCGKALATTWVLCPYCATPRTPVVVPGARREVPAASAESDEQTVALDRGAKRRPSTATYTPPATAKAAPAEGADISSASPSG
jgi:hypothetical protein